MNILLIPTHYPPIRNWPLHYFTYLNYLIVTQVFNYTILESSSDYDHIILNFAIMARQTMQDILLMIISSSKQKN
jgi:hypothetical protein